MRWARVHTLCQKQPIDDADNQRPLYWLLEHLYCVYLSELKGRIFHNAAGRQT